MDNQPIKRPVEDWAKDKCVSAWDFALAKSRERWAVGRELTEAAFNAAIERVRSAVLR